MKKDKKVISILICTFLMLGFGYFLKGYVKADFSKIKYGEIIKEGQYFYFTSHNVGDREITRSTLLKVSINGKEVIPLKEVNASRLSIYNGKIYFLNDNGLCRMNLDGSAYELIDASCSGDYYINNERIYYSKRIEASNTYTDVGKLNIYSCNLDLKDKKIIIKATDYFKMYKDKVYTGSHLSDNTTIVNELNIDGKLLRKLCSINNNLDYFEIEDGYLFYCSYDPNSEQGLNTYRSSSLNSIDIKTGEKRTLVKDNVLGYIIKYEKIYYSVSNEDPNKVNVNYLNYSCSLKGFEKRRNYSLGIVVCSLKDGKNIYYIDGGNNFRKGKSKGSEFSKGEILVPHNTMQNLKIKN